MSKNSGNTAIEPITLENYKERTAGMKRLIWEPTEKNLKANRMLQMYLGDKHNVTLSMSL